MTDREIKRLENNLPKWKDGKPPVKTEEQKRLGEELACRDMINSILIYHGESDLRPGSYFYQKYMTPYVYMLGAERVRSLCDEQVADFRLAVVCENVHVDNEGVSYNSILWADALVDAALDTMEHDLAAEGPENGTGYTLPDGKYHIFAYVDFIDDDRVIVLEPNKVEDGAHEPIGGDTYILPFGDVEAFKMGCMWCLQVMAEDKYCFDRLIDGANNRSGGNYCSKDNQEHERTI